MEETVISHGNKKETYSEFIDKFKEKHTTDDCYTPPAVYDAIADWVAERYNLDRKNFVRPFYPGGDYENYEYGPDDIVVDNPPFSILSKILTFYQTQGIKFFLFAPAITLFNSNSSSSAILVNTQIEYENGAKVSTSFMTNLEPGDIRFTIAPDLAQILKDVQEANKANLPKYRYPDNVVSSALLNKIIKPGISFTVKKSESFHIHKLDSQAEQKKTIFGGGYIISNEKAAELKAAELKAAELKAAELKAAELKAAEKAIEWPLSDREKDIVKQLDKNGCK